MPTLPDSVEITLAGYRWLVRFHATPHAHCGETADPQSHVEPVPIDIYLLPDEGERTTIVHELVHATAFHVLRHRFCNAMEQRLEVLYLFSWQRTGDAPPQPLTLSPWGDLFAEALQTESRGAVAITSCYEFGAALFHVLTERGFRP